MRIITSQDQAFLNRILSRSQLEESDITRTVAEILADIRKRGDEALFEYTARFDHAELTGQTIRVTPQEIDAAYTQTDPEFIAMLRRVIDNLTTFHSHQREENWFLPRFGGMVGQLVRPLDSVGIYAPGGTAALASSLLMGLIPAKVAGVQRIVVATPPSGGQIHPALLVACREGGATEIYKMGGAQAIGALAFGTQSVPRVDKIVGPGNAYVVNAKRQVFGVVGIDSFAGPSELVVIADAGANPAYVAADLLSQAEHDPHAAAIAITNDAAMAQAIAQQVEEQLVSLPRQAIARRSIDDNGGVIVVEDLKQAAEMSNRIAPEHLELCVRQPSAMLPDIRHAGAIFMGDYAPEPLGDYYAGPNHVLPTSTTARFFSPLTVHEFQKRSSVIQATREGMLPAVADIAAFARSEGLEAHARSAEIRRQS